jgi:hypothetical protein
MKTLLILIMFLIIGCQSAMSEKVLDQPLHIQIAAVESSEILHAFPMTPWHVLAFSQCHGTAVASIVYTANGVIVRYCYLDQGRLVGFVIDEDLHKRTNEKVYIVDEIPLDMSEELTRALNRVNSGLDPYELEKPDPL